MRKDIERDIILNAYYMISLFEDEKEKYVENLEDDPEKNSIPNSSIISNLKLQKLMYFVEAYYMNKYNEDFLYNSEWKAWDYGPVNIELYNHFKKFGSIEISLTEEEKMKINNLPKENKNFIKKIYDIFGAFNAFDLVTLTHLPGSPWSKLKSMNPYGFEEISVSIIKKKDTKKWFYETFGTALDLKKDFNEDE